MRSNRIKSALSVFSEALVEQARVGCAHAAAEDGQTRSKALGGEAPRVDQECTVSLQRSSGRTSQSRMCTRRRGRWSNSMKSARRRGTTASCKIWETALKTPPLPCARGGIKKHCETHGVKQEHGSASGLRVCVERALTGPSVRTTLRVVEPSSRKRTFWCEVRLKESKDHERIVWRVAAAVKSGSVVSKTAAQQLKDELQKLCQGDHGRHQ